MRFSTKFALTLTAAGLFVAGLMAVGLANVNERVSREMGNVFSVVLKSKTHVQGALRPCSVAGGLLQCFADAGPDICYQPAASGGIRGSDSGPGKGSRMLLAAPVHRRSRTLLKVRRNQKALAHTGVFLF